MARYRGPKSKITRRFKEAIFGPDKALERRPYGPGQHGNTRRRKKESEYSVQLAEKQKAKRDKKRGGKAETEATEEFTNVGVTFDVE